MESQEPRKNKDLRSEPHPTKKRRRRVLSCKTCRRLKCRCDFEDDSHTCSRCRSLRLICEPPDARNDDDVEDSSSQNSAQRLQALEETVTELKTMLRTTTNQQQTRQVRAPHKEQLVQNPQYQPVDNIPSKNPDVLHSLDCFSVAAPISVVRQAEMQVYGRRRPLDFLEIDLIANGLLDDQSCKSLIQGFLTQSRTLTHIVQIDSSLDDGTFRQSSPFLHAVLCLQGIKGNEFGAAYSQLHRQVYERVRTMQGQVLLASPLGIDESIATLVMAMFCSSPTHGPEYIDSWLMSGHCAQQFMLSTHFSGIMRRLESQMSSTTDLRTMRVWGNICLCHLQWAAATGRPPIIPKQYIKQNSALQMFLGAAVADILLYAEIALYSELCDRLLFMDSPLARNQLDNFRCWREDWAFIRDLPAAYFIDVGYQIACMTLSQRMLQILRDADADAPIGSAPSLPGGMPSGSENRDGFGLGSPKDVDASTSHPLSNRHIETGANSAALNVLRSYVRTASVSLERLPEFYVISVEYAILMIARSQVPPFEHSEKDEAITTLTAMLDFCTSGRLSQAKHGVDRALIVVKGEADLAADSQRQDSGPVRAANMQDPPAECSSPPAALSSPSQGLDPPYGVDQTDPQACSMPAVIDNTIEMQSFFSGGYLDMPSTWPWFQAEK